MFRFRKVEYRFNKILKFIWKIGENNFRILYTLSRDNVTLRSRKEANETFEFKKNTRRK